MPKIPFLSPLLGLSGRAHRKALKEIFISTVLSTMPIWLGGVLGGMLAKAKSAEASFFGVAHTNMSEFVSNGELYMLAVATLAPVFYFGSALEKGRTSTGAAGREGSPFPQQDFHRFLITVFIAAAAVVFFYMRRENVSGSPFVIGVSLVFYFASLLMIYAATAHNEERTNFEPFSVAADQQEDYQSEYSAHRGGQ